MRFSVSLLSALIVFSSALPALQAQAQGRAVGGAGRVDATGASSVGSPRERIGTFGGVIHSRARFSRLQVAGTLHRQRRTIQVERIGREIVVRPDPIETEHLSTGARPEIRGRIVSDQRLENGTRRIDVALDGVPMLEVVREYFNPQGVTETAFRYFPDVAASGELRLDVLPTGGLELQSRSSREFRLEWPRGVAAPVRWLESLLTRRQELHQSSGVFERLRDIP